MRKSAIALSILSIVFSNSVYANGIKSIKIGGYIIPPAFVNALEEGMSVPVFLRLNDDTKKNQSDSKIADAVIVIEQDKIKLASIHLIENNKGAKLNNLLMDNLEGLQNVIFNGENNIA
ncbi:fimbrial biogenesis outer membrane usher protein, partial [Providencia rettgeri]|nr:fimbrial biogenesis outer membrane usher protein [Providencia rettgeri]